MLLLGRGNTEKPPVSPRGEMEIYRSKYKIVSWLKNYGYYYKIPIFLTLCCVILAASFIVTMALRVENDLLLYVCTDVPLQEMQYEGLPAVLEPYAEDFNSDRRVAVDVRYINLAKNPQNGEQIGAYTKIQAVYTEPAAPVLLVDPYVYRYLMRAGALAPLSEYGVTGGMDEYRIPIHNLSCEAAGERLKYAKNLCLVFRVCPERDADRPQTQAAYGAMSRFMQDMADEYRQTQMAEVGSSTASAGQTSARKP